MQLFADHATRKAVEAIVDAALAEVPTLPLTKNGKDVNGNNSRGLPSDALPAAGVRLHDVPLQGGSGPRPPHRAGEAGMTLKRIRNACEPKGMTMCNSCHTLHKDEDFGRHFASCPMRQRWGYIEPVIVSPS